MIKKFQNTEPIGVITETTLHEIWGDSFKVGPLGRINFNLLTLCVTDANNDLCVINEKAPSGWKVWTYDRDGNIDTSTEYHLDFDESRVIEVRI